MRILIIDGQGGKIGKSLVEQLIAKKCNSEIYAVGTNSTATIAMIKAGAKFAATGENPVVVNAPNADIIIGPMGILAANSLMGEITPRMAYAISESNAQKILVPLNRCNITIAGISNMPVGNYIESAVNIAVSLCK